MSEILYGVKKLVLTELDPVTQLPKSGGAVCIVDTASEADLDPVVSGGDEKVLRDDNIVLAIARTSDLTYGYNFKFKDAAFGIEIASLIEGGKIIYDSVVTTKIIGYDSPMLADGDTTKPFLAEVYVANYRGDSIINYIKISLNNCTGKAPKMSFKQDFFAPEFEVKAREATIAAKPVKQISFVDSLPVADVTKPILTLTSTATVTKPAPVIAKSNKLGGLFLVASDAVVNTLANLQDLVQLHLGSYVSVLNINTDTNIATSSLAAGKYKVYAVDLVGNVSIASIQITLS